MDQKQEAPRKQLSEYGQQEENMNKANLKIEDMIGAKQLSLATE